MENGKVWCRDSRLIRLANQFKMPKLTVNGLLVVNLVLIGAQRNENTLVHFKCVY
jgi:hypothetical protein